MGNTFSLALALAPSGQALRTQIAHLARRAGFGLPPDMLDSLAQGTLSAAISYFVDDAALPDPGTPAPVYAMDHGDMTTVQRWWIERMLTSQRQLEEKMTLFWHGRPSPTTGKGAARPAWLDDQAPGTLAPLDRQRDVASVPDGAATATPGGAGWVLDHVAPWPGQARRGFEAPRPALRALVAASAVLIVVALASVLTGVLLVSVALLAADGLSLLTLTTLIYCYRTDPVVTAMRPVQAEVRRESRHVASCTRRLAEVERQQARLDAEHSARRTMLAEQKLARQEQEAALLRLQVERSPKINAYSRELDALNAAELGDMSRTLQAVREGFVSDYLRQCPVTAAGIPGVRDTVRRTLPSYGFTTAADLDYYALQRVAGLRLDEADALERWRQARVADGTRLIPTRLPPIEIAAIKNLYEPRRRVLQATIAAEHDRITSGASEVHERFRAGKHRIDRDQLAAQVKASRLDAAILERYSQHYVRLAKESARLGDDNTDVRDGLQRDAGGLRQDLAAHTWQHAKAQRELAAFGGLSLVAYARHVLVTDKSRAHP